MATVEEITQALTDAQAFVDTTDTTLDTVRANNSAQIALIADLKAQIAAGGIVTQAQLDAVGAQAFKIRDALGLVSQEAVDASVQTA